MSKASDQFYLIKCLTESGKCTRAALLPVVDLLACPAGGDVGIEAVALVRSAVRKSAVAALESDTLAGVVVVEFGSGDGVRGDTLLGPIHQLLDGTVFSVSCSCYLSKFPSALATRRAVSVTRDTVKTKEFVQLFVAGTHGFGDVKVVALRVLAGDVRVCHAVADG